jgi:recombination protein RecT
MNNVRDLVLAAKDQFLSVKIDENVNFEREAEFAIQQLQANDYILSVAMASKDSVIRAVANVSAIGISLNPAKKQAYLVPRGKKICLDISYIGLMDLAMETGSIKWAQSRIVRENDSFVINNLDQLPSHNFNPFSSAKNRGEIVGVYVVVKTCDNDYLTHTMSIDEINKIKSRSESGKKGSGPWVTDFEEMCKKSVSKQGYKYWPKTDRLSRAINYLDNEGDQGIDFSLENSKTIEFYSDADFAEKSEKWSEVVKSGRKSSIEFVAFVESKGTLFTNEQKEIIGTWGQK